MKIKVFTNKKVNDAHAYLIENETQKTGLLIDTADMALDILSFIKNEGIKLENIILTHGHWDHIKGINTINKEAPMAKIWIGKRDRKAMHNSFYNMSLLSKITEPWKTNFNPLVEPVDEVIDVKLSELKVRIIPAPGHTPGSLMVSLPDENCLFTGDLMFIKDDEQLFPKKFWDGNLNYNPIKFKKSLNRLFKNFSDNWKIYPGHWDYGFTLENIPDKIDD